MSLTRWLYWYLGGSVPSVTVTVPVTPTDDRLLWGSDTLSWGSDVLTYG